MRTYKSRGLLIKCLALVLLAVLSLSMTACGTYIDPSAPGSGNSPNSPSTGDDAPLFTVDLMLDGRKYSPPIEMYAQWRGDNGIYSAKFDSVGHAEIRGLDGDYHVTLSKVPDGFTYDCNGYTVSNYNRSIEIEMLQIIPTTGAGSGMYSSIKINKLGTYRTRLTSKSHAVFYEYMPLMQGRYSVQSWVDISENEINPIMEVYGGTSQFKFFLRTQDGGGMSSTYTKNFKLELELTSDMVGNVWTFQVHADCRSGIYPIDVDFTIKYEDDYKSDNGVYENYYATGPFYDSEQHGTVSGRPSYIFDSTGGILDASRVKLNSDDRFYHVYDETLYASSGGYGPILFAYLNKDSRLISTASGKGFLDDYICGWLRYGGKRYWWQIKSVLPNGTEVWTTDPNCFIMQYVNHGVDGGHPVTEEIKEFLQGWALSQSYFNDGNGWAEAAGLKSNEENQWLFNCYYYA